ncbi:MAG: T9SS type A sorting domain-containing protein [Ignavibacteriales bacterium]
MKKLAFYLILTVLSLNAYAQVNDTTYFPSKLGNTWVYQYDDGRIEVEKITQDSTDQRGNRFLRFNNDSTWFDRWDFMVSPNQDSIFLSPTRRKELVYRFPITGNTDRWTVKPGKDTIGNTPKIAFITKTYDANIFGKYTTAYAIRYFYFRVENGDTLLDFRTWERDEIIAKGFGLVWEGIEVEYKTLIGCVINGDTLGYLPTSVKEDKGKTVPDNFVLEQNYPNPFNPSTVISFNLPVSSDTELKVYDMFGREVRTLVNGFMTQGKHSVTFNAGDISSGLYFYKLTVGKSSITKKMLYLK